MRRLVVLAVDQQFGEAGNRRQRRTQLVRRGAEELALHA